MARVFLLCITPANFWRFCQDFAHETIELAAHIRLLRGRYFAGYLPALSNSRLGLFRPNDRGFWLLVEHRVYLGYSLCKIGDHESDGHACRQSTGRQSTGRQSACDKGTGFKTGAKAQPGSCESG